MSDQPTPPADSTAADQTTAPAAEAPAAAAPVTPASATKPAAEEPAVPDQSKETLSSDMDAEIDAAMAQLGLAEPTTGGKPEADAGDAPHPSVTPVGGPAKAQARPRVVQSGREHRTGKVVSVGPTDIFIEFGPKELGVIERAQFKDKDGNEADLPVAGADLEVVINKYEASESLYICARPGTVQKADWEMLEAGQTVEGRVTGVNKGGLEIEIAGHKAFLPASQVSLERIPDLSIFVGEKLACQVQRVDRRGSGNIVLSRREMLKEEKEKAAAKLREALKEGETVTGRVRKIMPFGAFVDIGGLDGLIHISDMSHERINTGEKNIARYVTEGKEVKVKILTIDWDKNRISLGMKQLQADPFEAAAADIVEGAEVTGKVTRIADFGCFIEVAPGVEGLCHISELEWRRVGHPSDVVTEGEVVQVKVLKIDPSDRKVSLSIKALKDAPQRPQGGGRGRGDRDGRTAEEIQAERDTPQLRRMREQAKKQAKQSKSAGGLGDIGGIGLGDLKL